MPQAVNHSQLTSPGNSDRPPSVVAYTTYPWGHALTALRLEEPLQQAGVQLIRGVDFDPLGNPLADPSRVDQADIVIIQRDFPRWEQDYQAVMVRARQQAKPVVYEADDLLLDLPEDHPDRSLHYYSRATYPMLRAILEADGVTASTPALGQYLRRLHPNTWVLPNYLIDRLWPVERLSTTKTDLTTVVIGYMGTSSHIHDLEMISPILQGLISRYGSQISFKFWGISPPAGLVEHAASPSQVEEIPLKIENYAEFATFFASQVCDIFIAPLTDSPFNRSKSSIKYLEYSALGIPGVYSDITPYQDLILPGVNGFLAASRGDWDFHLGRLIESPDLRLEIGQAALETVRKDWLLSTHANDWSSTYNSLIQAALQEKPEQRQLRLTFSGVAAFAQEWQQALEMQVTDNQNTIRELEHQLEAKNHLLHQDELVQRSQDSGKMLAAYFQALRDGLPYENDAEVMRLFQIIARQVASRIPISSQTPFTVLDVGCGAGRLVEALRQQELEATGIEFVESLRAQDDAGSLLQQNQPFCRSFEAGAPLSGKYDLVISLETLQYLDRAQMELVVAQVCAVCDDALISCNPSNQNSDSPEMGGSAGLLAELFGQHGFFRDVDFDAWFISPWAIRFRRQTEPAARLAANYERRLLPALDENRELRTRLAAMRRNYDQQIDQLRAENALIPGLRQQVQELSRKVQELSREVNELSDQILEWHQHWTAVQGGMAWRTVQAMVRLQPRLAPTGSRRYLAVQWLFATTRIIARRLRGRSAEIPPPPASEADISIARQQPVEIQSGAETLAIAYYTTDPWTAACAHLRVVGPANSPQSGILVLPGTNWESDPILEFPEQSQAILIQRDFPRHEQLYKQVIDWARSTRRPVIYEIDDLLTELPEEHPETSYYQEIRSSMLEAIRSADAVVVATLPLAEYARQFNPNTWVLPNYLDRRIWRTTQSATSIRFARRPVVVGYMGGLTKTHIPDLELVVPTLLRLLRRYHGRVQLRFWGLLPPELEGLAGVEFRSERFPNYLEFADFFSTQSCDLFIAPLRDSQFNRCKSPIKYLEYSALGIPGVYSRITPYSSVVIDGKNGFLAGDEYEWDDLITRLIENPKLRQHLGQAARRTVEKYFNMPDHAHEWGTIYRSALAAAGHPQSSLSRLIA